MSLTGCYVSSTPKLFLNPSKQAASLAKGLEHVSFLIVQGRMWETLYIRRCETNTGEMEHSSRPIIEHIAFKEALERLYREILRFQIISYCYYDSNSAVRLGQDMIEWNEWNNLLENIQEQEQRFALINITWKDTTYAQERSAAEKRHLEAIGCWQNIGTDISTLLEVVRGVQSREERKELLDWLCTVDPSEAYNAARDRHTNGTSDWLVRDSNKTFKTWEKSTRSLLWLNGKRKSGCDCLPHRSCSR